MERIENSFIKNHGFARMKELKESGIHTRKIAEAAKLGIIEKVRPGLYKLVDYPWDEHSSYVDIAQSKKNAIICLTSALAYYELSTIIPSVITIAVPMNTDKFSIEYPPVKVYYFSDKFYFSGIEEINTASGSFKIYNREKTICDMFRYRNKLGEDIALEGLKKYINSKNADLVKLREFAIICRIYTIISPYIKALVIR